MNKAEFINEYETNFKGTDFRKDLDQLLTAERNGTIEDCQQRIRYLLKHQNYPTEEDMSDYENGFTNACELAEEDFEELSNKE